DPTCSNGASDYPTCTPPQPPTCSNGASDYPTCTVPPDPTCSNGASDYPTCTQPPDPTCSNGASDYPTCTPSTDGLPGDGGENSGEGDGGDGGGAESEIISNIKDSVGVVTDATISVLKDVGETLIEIPGVKTVVDAARVAIEKTGRVIDNPTVEKVDETVAAPILAATAVVNVVVGGVTLLSQILIFLRLLFLQPLLLLFKRRKQKTWGTVFNTYTKQPLDLAMVRLVHGENDKIVRTQVTDAQGRYFMAAGSGTYLLKTTKEGFGPHSSIHDEDSVYSNLYHGEKLELRGKESELNYNIPLEPVYEEKSTASIIKEYTRRMLQKTLSLIGAIATIVSLIISPTVWMGGLLVVHLLLYIVMKRFAAKKVKGDHGQVVETKTKKPLKKVVIRVFDNAYNKLVDTAITDNDGNYAILVGPSIYYITAEKEGYVRYQSPIIDLSSEKTAGIGGVIAENVFLESLSEKKPE
ncbi:MAG TPA: carboxypeptidase regulatory-like domain-containing protein, partial [Candidatus Magasanikbacteria bacterium]|nr:carboxypeptidase regulatory-like domain-containing protein [Candidatus Magasanikbacteria bacterium]